MPPTPALPDPADARTPAELALYMRKLREASGLTYRDLEQRAEQAGEVLPRSTLATALSRDALPRPELLRAFLIACGHRDRVEVWTAARDRIAAEAGARTQTPATEPPTGARAPIGAAGTAGTAGEGPAPHAAPVVPGGGAGTGTPGSGRTWDPIVDRISDPIADRILDPVADRISDPNLDRMPDPNVDRISDPNEDRILDPNTDLVSEGDLHPAPARAADPNPLPAPAPDSDPAVGPDRTVPLDPVPDLALRPAVVRSPRPPHGGTSSAPRARPARRLVPLAVGLLALVVVAIGGGHFVRAGFPVSAPADSEAAGSSEGPRPGPVEAGTYRIRAVGSGLCLGESTTRDGGGAVEQYACPATVPVYLLEPAGGDRYTIRSLHPVLGHGCLGVDAGLRTEGARLMNDYCGRRGTAERFSIRPAAGVASGTYRILPVHTGACVTVPGGNRTPGAAAIQLPCTQAQSGQLFAFDPVPAPTAVPDIRSN